MTTPASCRMFDPRRENVHPLIDSSRFHPDTDYYGAIYDFAVLATRLLNSPQLLQHDYCFYYGENAPANFPTSHDRSKITNRPCQYACDKTIGELDQTDIRYVEQQRNCLAQRVLFYVADLGPNTLADCTAQDVREGARGAASLIRISMDVYNRLLEPNLHHNDLIRVKFILALTLLHELAHAAHNHLFGGDIFEHFREDSHVSEGGFEIESRIFGQRPEFDIYNPKPNSRVIWSIWQSHESLPRCYRVDELAPDAWQMPKDRQMWWMDGLDFVKKLFDDDFWEGNDSEYAMRGAFALIPDKIAFSCLTGKRDNMIKTIPLSIKDLFRDEGLSYAKKRYSRFANP